MLGLGKGAVAEPQENDQIVGFDHNQIHLPVTIQVGGGHGVGADQRSGKCGVSKAAPEQAPQERYPVPPEAIGPVVGDDDV